MTLQASWLAAGDSAAAYARWQRGARSNRSELAGAPSSAALQQPAGGFF